MNSVQIMGNLARDPNVRATRTGRAVASFSVAVNRNYVTAQGEQRELTDWINVVAWGNLAESVGNQLRKGSRVFVEGRISSRSYDTPDGQRRYVTEVVANIIATPLGGSHNTDAAGGSFSGQGGNGSGGYDNNYGGGSYQGNGGYRNRNSSWGNGGGYGGQGGYNNGGYSNRGWNNGGYNGQNGGYGHQDNYGQNNFGGQGGYSQNGYNGHPGGYSGQNAGGATPDTGVEAQKPAPQKPSAAPGDSQVPAKDANSVGKPSQTKGNFTQFAGGDKGQFNGGAAGDKEKPDEEIPF